MLANNLADNGVNATVAALLPAPRTEDSAIVAAGDGTGGAAGGPWPVPVLLTELPDEDTLAMREEAEIEARHRRAAEQGEPGAMSALGTLLLRRGDLDAAEPFLRAAVQHGDRAAANNLGLLLNQHGKADEAADWWRIAAVAGSAAAAHALGRHYRERGDEPGAEYWLRQAAESGHTLGAYALADLLDHRRDVGAERWFRAAAEHGHREAAYRLARACAERGEDHEAEQWYG
ncbi:Tetratricopeptide repeat-containing protein, partial [Streptomyces sp. DvalAA-14]